MPLPIVGRVSPGGQGTSAISAITTRGPLFADLGGVELSGGAAVLSGRNRSNQVVGGIVGLGQNGLGLLMPPVWRRDP